MMVESCEHRLLSFLFLSLGRRATLLLLCLLLGLSGWLQLLGNPVLSVWPLWLLLPPTLVGRRARTLLSQARSVPYYLLVTILTIDCGSGVGGCIWVHRSYPRGLMEYIGVGRKYSTNAHNQWLMEIKPISMAVMAAWVRSEAPNLLSMRPTWFLTVLVLRSNSLAICSLVRPCDMSLKTSASRGESSVFAAAAGGVPSSCVVGASGTGLIHSSSTCFSCFSWLRRNRSRLVTS